MAACLLSALFLAPSVIPISVKYNSSAYDQGRRNKVVIGMVRFPPPYFPIVL